MSAMDKLLGRSIPSDSEQKSKPIGLMQMLTNPDALQEAQQAFQAMAFWVKKTLTDAEERQTRIEAKQDEILKLLKQIDFETPEVTEHDNGSSKSGTSIDYGNV